MKIVKLNILRWKEILSKKKGFLKIKVYFQFLWTDLMQQSFVNPTIRKPTTNISEQLDFWPIPSIPSNLWVIVRKLCAPQFNAPKKSHYIYFFRTYTKYFCENHKTRVGVQHMQKLVQSFVQCGGSRMYTVS